MRPEKTAFVFAVVYGGLCCWLLHDFFIWNMNVIAGTALLPYLYLTGQGAPSWRFLIPALAAIALALAIPAASTFFFALLCCLLLLAENYKGKVSLLLPLLLLLISPVFSYISTTLTIPLRLWLSEVTAQCLSLAGLKAQASGIVIELNDTEFSVDQACAGLNMLTISLIISIFMLAFFERTTGKKLPPWLIVLCLTGTFLLNVAGNLIRIILLVLFKIMPGTFMHDLTGILCLLAYTIVPSFLLIQSVYGQRKCAANLNHNRPEYLRNTSVLMIHSVCILLILLAGLRLPVPGEAAHKWTSGIPIKGFKREYLKDNTIKLTGKDALIYIKPMAFYAPEHNPMICWTGSGYEFSSIKRERLRGYDIYTAIFIKGNEKIYSSWWFDNQRVKTISQLDWRLRSATGQQPFFMINVNAASPGAMKLITGRLISATAKISKGIDPEPEAAKIASPDKDKRPITPGIAQGY